VFEVRQAKLWPRGVKENQHETQQRFPAGESPVREGVTPPPGSECCVVEGNLAGEAYTARA